MTLDEAVTAERAVAGTMPQRESFGHTPDGTPVDVFTFSNVRSTEAGIDCRLMPWEPSQPAM